MQLSEEDTGLLQRYAINLVRVYFQYSNPSDYPLVMEDKEGWVGVMELPHMPYANTFVSRDEVYGRIKALSHLLGATVLKGTVGDISVELRL